MQKKKKQQQKTTKQKNKKQKQIKQLDQSRLCVGYIEILISSLIGTKKEVVSL